MGKLTWPLYIICIKLLGSFIICGTIIMPLSLFNIIGVLVCNVYAMCSVHCTLDTILYSLYNIHLLLNVYQLGLSAC